MNLPMLQGIHDLVSKNAELFTCLGFLVGLLLGNRLAIGRDKRKEFNEIADSLFATIEKAFDRNGPYNIPTRDSFTMLRRHFSPLRRWLLDKAIDEYEKEIKRTRQDEYGQVFFEDVHLVNLQLKKLRKYTRRI